ncbi:glycosyltransferase [Chitinophagaceae bacterium LB-8]|uniref:Glycosyltransferase n=1 Tax=Paraflavisolibacter caeni TaxID=2982496 RepID=A0A9X2XYM7_9BACT|nr:glycosyltransferase [Paraflavisolibacter caeni]MCU7551296.1 glycosyltransferase [Paraflavisolibacter caeni]
MLTVIIPNFNHARYLEQRIQTVLYQTYQDFEIIILDDCSTDESRNVIEKYRNHPKVSNIIFNEQNSGSTFKQWNKGIDLAKGEVIWIAESDDKADPNFIATLIGILDEEPRVGIVYSNSYFIDEENNILNTYNDTYASWSNRWEQDYINKGSDEVVNYMRFSPVILNVSSCIFRKSIYESVGRSGERYKLAGDWFTYVKMLQCADIAYCADPLNYFRCHTQTVRSSSNQFVHFFESLKVICYIYQNFHVPYSEKKAQVYNILAQLRQLDSQFTSQQKSEVMSYLRKNLMRNVDILWWKYNASMQIKKIFHA